MPNKVVLSEIDNQIRRKKRLIEQNRERLAEHEADLAALLRTQRIIRNGGAKAGVAKPEIDVSARELAGLSLSDALVYLAERGRGFVRSSQVRPILVAAEVISSKGATQKLSAALSESERYDREGRGVYRLRPDSQQAAGGESDESQERGVITRLRPVDGRSVASR